MFVVVSFLWDSLFSLIPLLRHFSFFAFLLFFFFFFFMCRLIYTVRNGEWMNGIAIVNRASRAGQFLLQLINCNQFNSIQFNAIHPSIFVWGCHNRTIYPEFIQYHNWKCPIQMVFNTNNRSKLPANWAPARADSSINFIHDVKEWFSPMDSLKDWIMTNG